MELHAGEHTDGTIRSSAGSCPEQIRDTNTFATEELIALSAIVAVMVEVGAARLEGVEGRLGLVVISADVWCRER